MNNLLKNEIDKVLLIIKVLAEEGHVEFQESNKNIETSRKVRRELGITYVDFKNEIIEALKRLKIENYYQGPDLDDNSIRDLIFWKFGIRICNMEIYLKLDIRESCGKKLVLWSFHEPDYKIKYPFR